MFRVETEPLPGAENLFFRDDDFYEIHNTYFRDIVEKRTWKALPGGVASFSVPEYENIPDIWVTSNDLSGYRFDTSPSLATAKESAKYLLSNWLNKSVETNNFTLCPSISHGLLAVLWAIKESGIQNVLFEAPAYYASVVQATKLELKPRLLPTQFSRNFEITPHDISYLNDVYGKYAIVITQPKYGTGIDRSISNLNNCLELMSDGSVVIVDEAVDQKFPATLGTDFGAHANLTMFRLRGFMKPMALNGVKAAACCHPSAWAARIRAGLEATGGTLDAYAARFLESCSQDLGLFKSLCDKARHTVAERARQFAIAAQGPHQTVIPIENGYLGALQLDITLGKRTFEAQRNRLLDIARDEGVPVQLGPSMYFPCDLRHEYIRINYFSDLENLLRSAHMIKHLLNRLHYQ
jgi:DNA-binding transcriptional MocR family regulator